jgi:hypothetical protein
MLDQDRFRRTGTRARILEVHNADLGPVPESWQGLVSLPQDDLRVVHAVERGAGDRSAPSWRAIPPTSLDCSDRSKRQRANLLMMPRSSVIAHPVWARPLGLPSGWSTSSAVPEVACQSRCKARRAWDAAAGQRHVASGLPGRRHRCRRIVKGAVWIGSRTAWRELGQQRQRTPFALRLSAIPRGPFHPSRLRSMSTCELSPGAAPRDQ